MNPYSGDLDANDETLFDDFQYVKFKIQEHTYITLTYTNKKLSFIVSIFNMLLIEGKISKEDIVSVKRQDGYKFIIQAIGKYFYRTHGEAVSFKKGNKVKLYDLTRSLLLTCMNDTRVNCNFMAAYLIDNCMVKIILSCLNIRLFHTWIPDRDHLIEKFHNCENLAKLINTNNLGPLGDFSDQVYTRDFMMDDTRYGVTPAGLRSLIKGFGEKGSAIYYSYGCFEVIFRYNSQILAIESNRNSRLHNNVLFRKVSLKNEAMYYNNRFEVVTIDGKVQPLVTFTYDMPLFPGLLPSDAVETEIKKFEPSGHESSIYCQLLEKLDNKQKLRKNLSSSQRKAKGPRQRNFFPFVTMPSGNDFNQQYYYFSSKIPENKNVQSDQNLQFPLNDTENYQPQFIYFPDQPYMTLRYSWPPYYWYLQSNDPNPYYVHNILLSNPYYQLLQKNNEFTVQPQQSKSFEPIPSQISDDIGADSGSFDEAQRKKYVEDQWKFLNYVPEPTKFELSSKSSTFPKTFFSRPENFEKIKESNIRMYSEDNSNEIMEEKCPSFPFYLQYELINASGGHLFNDRRLGLKRIFCPELSETWNNRMAKCTIEQLNKSDPWIIELCRKNIEFLSK